uniref:Uncharacterized protein n=1 Tax=Romanomermis culicivorax TaxID=13658 RepID=A0A915IFZ5_ROMCU
MKSTANGALLTKVIMDQDRISDAMNPRAHIANPKIMHTTMPAKILLDGPMSSIAEKAAFYQAQLPSIRRNRGRDAMGYFQIKADKHTKIFSQLSEMQILKFMVIRDELKDRLNTINWLNGICRLEVWNHFDYQWLDIFTVFTVQLKIFGFFPAFPIAMNPVNFNLPAPGTEHLAQDYTRTLEFSKHCQFDRRRLITS